MTKTEQKAWIKKGELARINGASHWKNPAKTTKQYTCWLKGWTIQIRRQN